MQYQRGTSLLNRNTIKVSNMPNLKKKVSNHNRKILKEADKPTNLQQHLQQNPLQQTTTTITTTTTNTTTTTTTKSTIKKQGKQQKRKQTRNKKQMDCNC